MIGKPDSGKLNVRFDEGELEIGHTLLRQLSTLPSPRGGGRFQRPSSLPIGLIFRLNMIIVRCAGGSRENAKGAAGVYPLRQRPSRIMLKQGGSDAHFLHLDG